MYLIFTLAFLTIELIGNNICLGLPDCGVRSQNLLPQEQLTAKRRDVAIGQYPWVVAIYIAEDDKCDKYKQICGGTIISENWVVTAGHCVCSFNPGVYRIHAGFNDSSELTVPSAKIYEVSNIFMHPDFTYYNLVNDIALLRTSKPIDISTGEININRICLPSADEAIGSKIAAAGWVEDLKADKKKH
uniref:U6-Theriditoxin-Lha1a_1 n=1 Tax=Latrodectus hasselti TaxID=256736 RepID=A0A482ZAD5_LATHA